jgi:hypothetical protein
LGFFCLQIFTAETAESAEKNQVKVKVQVKKGGVGWPQPQPQPFVEVLCVLCELCGKTIKANDAIWNDCSTSDIMGISPLGR